MADFKLAIVAGHYMNTPGKRCLKALDPAETREWWLNDRIVDYIQKGLAAYNGIEIKRLDDPTGKSEITLAARTSAANSWKADFYLSIHHNAGVKGGAGGGIVAYVYSGTKDAVTLAWQKELYNALIAKTGLKGNRGTPLAKADLHECRETSMPAVLLELGFMDSSTDVPIILTDKFAKACAEACIEVIVKRAGLTKKAVTTTTTSTTVKTYKVVTNINKYSTAADAKAQKNAKTGKLSAGTYYIYTKYPTGVNGMYNISTDKTGASAGSWINPAENVAVAISSIAVTTKPAKTTYYVGDTYDGTGLVVTATYSDKSTKTVTGYSVSGFSSAKAGTSTINVTFEGKAATFKVTIKEKEAPAVAVYDLEYPEKNKIIDSAVKRTNTDCVKAIKKILANNSRFDVSIAKAFFELAPVYGIDPMMAIAQSILETGWFKYAGSAVTADHHNYCGLGVTTTGKPGATFDTVVDGINAQLQHLFAYGCKNGVPAGITIVDPRFNLVTRGIATYWQQLAGRWACPGYDTKTYATAEAAMKAENTYGQKIRAIYNQLITVAVTTADVEKYFPSKVEKPVEPEVVAPEIKEDPVVDIKPEDIKPETNEPNTTEPETTIKPDVAEPDTNEAVTDDVEDAENVDDQASDLATLIFNILKKLIKMIADTFSKGE